MGDPAPSSPLGVAGKLVALLAAFVVASIVAGVLTAGLFMPAVGATGNLARSSVDFFDALPEELQAQPLSQQSRVLWADGSTMATFYEQNRVVVPLANVAPVLRQAVVAIEDSRFYEHGGVDPRGMTRAFVNNFVGGDTQGASTLTQQWIKNVLAEQARREGGQEAYRAVVAEDYGRKTREIKLAIAAERRLTKDQILENYLNIALFGDGQYGIATAAQHFFNKRAADLTLPEAALLAGMIQSPRSYDPVDNPEQALERRNVVLSRMLRLGLIDRAQHDEAVAVPLEAMLHIQQSRNGCEQAGAAAFFCDYVITTLTRDPAFGDTPEARQQLLYRGGLTIATTLDKPKQQAADAAVKGAVAPTDGAASALVSVEPGTGRIVAMAQNRTYDPREGAKAGGTSINYNVDAPMGGGKGFQVGSTFKPVTLATWLSAGKSLLQPVNAPRRATIPYGSVKAGCTRLDARQTWPVSNSEGQGGGRLSVLEGTYRSVNTAYANMLLQLDLCNIVGTAQALGIHRADGAEMKPYPSFILGVEEIAPLTMASAYASFAQSGTYCAPMAITEVKNAAGKVIAAPQPQCKQAIKPDVADGVAFALTNTLDRGTARCCDIPWPAAGKTGTTNDSTETWFVGFTKQLSTAVWVGTPDQAPSVLDTTPINGRTGRVFGSTIAAPAWHAYMSGAMQGQPQVPFARAKAQFLVAPPKPRPRPAAPPPPAATAPPSAPAPPAPPPPDDAPPSQPPDEDEDD
jgi:membrane peptidoglycan carboxypeptidase